MISQNSENVCQFRYRRHISIRENCKIINLHHTIIKPLNRENKYIVWKAAREKNQVMYKGKPIRADASIELKGQESLELCISSSKRQYITMPVKSYLSQQKEEEQLTVKRTQTKGTRDTNTALKELHQTKDKDQHIHVAMGKSKPYLDS